MKIEPEISTAGVICLCEARLTSSKDEGEESALRPSHLLPPPQPAVGGLIWLELLFW